jgi:hypothetical protein
VVWLLGSFPKEVLQESSTYQHHIACKNGQQQLLEKWEGNGSITDTTAAWQQDTQQRCGQFIVYKELFATLYICAV